MKNKTILVSLITAIIICTSCRVTMNSHEKKLYAAITNGNYQGVVEVLRDNPEINLEDIGTSEITNFSMKDRRALGIAIGSGTQNSEKIAKLMIDSGAKVNSVGETKVTYLMESYGELTSALLKAGADVNSRDEAGLTALDYTVSGADPRQSQVVYKSIKRLMRYGAVADEMTMQACLENPNGYEFAPYILDLIEKEGRNAGISEALKYAIKGDDKDLIKAIEEGAVSKEEKQYISMYAAIKCDVRTLKTIYAQGFNFSVKDDFGQTPLDLAARYNGVNEISFLADQGLDIDNISEIESDEMAMSPILYAIISGKEENLDFFLGRGIPLEDGDISSVWGAAFEYGNLASVALVEKYGKTPREEDLYAACISCADRQDGQGEVLFEYLLNNYNVLSLRDELGTSLLAGIAGFNADYAIKLLELGVRTDLEAITNAIDGDNIDLAEELIGEIDNVNTEYENLYPPLMSAVNYGELDLVKMLVKKGADINYSYTDEGGYTETAIHVAAYSPSKDILTYLIDHGADLTLKNSDGNTPYDLAKQAGLKENIELIKEKM